MCTLRFLRAAPFKQLQQYAYWDEALQRAGRTMNLSITDDITLPANSPSS
ncbi:hypothetical protein KCP76_07515 [Salmonella enterica subsp. enterica serovar Weltevreden]|nr:hypothetical protein KCP76_07515 [Salmonella enterica subsp. enterica serovar Weltevreden]